MLLSSLDWVDDEEGNETSSYNAICLDTVAICKPRQNQKVLTDLPFDNIQNPRSTYTQIVLQFGQNKKLCPSIYIEQCHIQNFSD